MRVSLLSPALSPAPFFNVERMSPRPLSRRVFFPFPIAQCPALPCRLVLLRGAILATIPIFSLSDLFLSLPTRWSARVACPPRVPHGDIPHGFAFLDLLFPVLTEHFFGISPFFRLTLPLLNLLLKFLRFSFSIVVSGCVTASAKFPHRLPQLSACASFSLRGPPIFVHRLPAYGCIADEPNCTSSVPARPSFFSLIAPLTLPPAPGNPGPSSCFLWLPPYSPTPISPPPTDAMNA